MPIYVEHFLLCVHISLSGMEGGLIQLQEANVSMQVASQTRHFPLENGKMVTPSSRLPSRDRPVGSKIDGNPANLRARLMTSFMAC